MSGQILQFGTSLAAILFLAWLAVRLHLGGDARIQDEAHARVLADEAICGFDPVDLAIDRSRTGAVLRNAAGQVMILRRHGSHFAARLLDNPERVRLDRNFLTLGTNELSFGEVTLDLGKEAQRWAASLRRLGA